MDLLFEVDLDQNVIQLHGYTLLDSISDIGSIQALLIQVFAYLLSIWNYKQLDNYLASRLYKLKLPKQESA